MSDLLNALERYMPQLDENFSVIEDETEDEDSVVLGQNIVDNDSELLNALERHMPQDAIPSPSPGVRLDSQEDEDELGLIVNTNNIRSYRDVRRNKDLQTIAQRFAKEH